MEKVRESEGDVKDDVIHVEIVGATLVVRAIRELLQIQPGFDVTGDSVKPLSTPHIVLILGQDGIAALKRRQLRSTRRQRPERFVLLTNGVEIDFRLARDLPICVFISSDDSVPVFLQGLRAAAAGNSFCSSQVVPFLLAATSAPSGKVRETSGPPPSAVAVSSQRVPCESKPTESPSSRVAASAAHKGNGLSEEMRRALKRGLSHREAEIALQASEGLSNQQIADATNVTLSTVKFHLYRVYQKLGIDRRSQLSGLTTPPEQETMV